MSDDEHEEPSPVTAFLAPLELGQHRAVMKRLGYDNPADFAVQTPEDAHDMKSALKQELVLVQTAIADASAKRDKR